MDVVVNWMCCGFAVSCYEQLHLILSAMVLFASGLLDGAAVVGFNPFVEKTDNHIERIVELNPFANGAMVMDPRRLVT